MKRLAMSVVIAAAVGMPSCTWMPRPTAPACDAQSVREYLSPDGKKKAVEYHSTCKEGPKPHHTAIEIADADGKNAASAMFATPQKQQPPAWPKLKVEWKSATELWVTYPARVDAQCISSPPGVTVHCVDASIAR